MHGATAKGHLEIAKLLIGVGANVNLQNNDGCTPAHLLAMGGEIKGLFAFMKLFSENSFDVSIKDGHGMTLLHSILSKIPLLSRADELVKPFLNISADVNLKDHQGNTPLHLAVKDQAVVKLLVGKGADINAKNQEGNTPLHLAAKLKDQAVVKLLVEKANINDENKEGNTPLHLAVSSGGLNIVEYLVENGANINIRNMNSKTPLNVAKSCKGPDITKFLQKKDKLEETSDYPMKGVVPEKLTDLERSQQININSGEVKPSFSSP